MNEKLRDEQGRYEELSRRSGDKQRELEKEVRSMQEKFATEKHELETSVQRKQNEINEVQKLLELLKISKHFVYLKLNNLLHIKQFFYNLQ